MSNHGWNFRVIRSVADGEVSFDIHEVYYDKDGKPFAWSEEPVAPTGATKEELRRDLMLQLAALDKPTLEVTTPVVLVEVDDEEDE